MTRRQLIDALAKYRRPGTPNYEYYFRCLPAGVGDGRNVRTLLSILADERLPARIRDHAGGALGETRDKRAVGPLIGALGILSARSDRHGRGDH